MRRPGIYNIGGGEQTAISLLECFDILEEILGKRPEVRFEEERHGDLSYFICDIQKAKRELQWEPRILPKEGIAKLVTWIQDNTQLFQKQ